MGWSYQVVLKSVAVILWMSEEPGDNFGRNRTPGLKMGALLFRPNHLKWMNWTKETLMKRVSANQAKQHFGELLDAAQRAPVLIERHGRPKAVIVSFEEYDEEQRRKLWALKRDLSEAEEQLDRGMGRSFDPDRIKREGRKIAAARKSNTKRS